MARDLVGITVRKSQRNLARNEEEQERILPCV